jgi:vitamin B12 transporter
MTKTGGIQRNRAWLRSLLACGLLLGGLAGLARLALAFEAAEPHVITATRTETPPEQVASAISVITREELDQRQVRYVADALRAIPGLAVNRSGSFGATTQVRMRGAEGNHTLVLIDGIEMNDPAFSEYDFGNLLVGDIERIEVLRGPQSVLYGSEAIGGVINILSRRPEPGFEATGRFELGGLRTKSGSLELRGADETSWFTLNGQGTWTHGAYHADRDNGNYDEDGFREYSVAARLGFTPTEAFGLDGSFRLTRSRAGVDGFDGSLPADADLKTYIDQFYGIVNARFRLFEGRLDSRFSAAFTDSERDNEGFDALESPVDTFSDGERIKLEFQTALELDESSQLVLGAESEREKAENGGTIDDHVWTAGYFAEYQLAVRERLFLTAGMRLDDHQLFGTHPTYRLTAAYQIPATGTKLKATWGTGFTSPTMDELFPDLRCFDFICFEGNPDLQPERSKGWDVGIEQALFDERLNLDVTYFENQVKDLIALDFFASPATSTNVNKSRARGVEVALTARPQENLDLSASYTFTWTHSDETHDRLLRRPPHIGSLVLNYRPLARANVNVGVYYNGRQDDWAQTTLGDYVLVHLGLSWEATARLTLFGRVENLFDDEYEEVNEFGSVGRTAYAGLELRF